MDNTTPPFAPGDKIIRIGTSNPSFGVIRGQQYVVDSIYWCCDKAGWKLFLVDIGTMPSDMMSGCIWCHRPAKRLPLMAKLFVKVDDTSEYTADSLIEELEKPITQPQTEYHG